MDNTKLSPHIILLDGGVGSEIDKARDEEVKGSEQEYSNDTSWCAMAHVTHPHIVRKIHRDFVTSGSQVIIANTYAAMHYLLKDTHQFSITDTTELAESAVKLAKEAAAPGVKVGGSMSIHGSNSGVTPEEAAQSYEILAQGILNGGADCIFLEMMRDPLYSALAIKAASNTELPLFLGISVSRNPQTHEIIFFGDNWEFTSDNIQHLISLCGPQLQCVGIMHSKLDDICEAWALLTHVWKGKTMIYPERGTFTEYVWRPDKSDITDTIEYAQHVTRVAHRLGVSYLGGCCGHGPKFIENVGSCIKLTSKLQ